MERKKEMAAEAEQTQTREREAKKLLQQMEGGGGGVFGDKGGGAAEPGRSGAAAGGPRTSGSGMDVLAAQMEALRRALAEKEAELAALRAAMNEMRVPANGSVSCSLQPSNSAHSRWHASVSKPSALPRLVAFHVRSRPPVCAPIERM